jgi:hypothetical protein
MVVLTMCELVTPGPDVVLKILAGNFTFRVQQTWYIAAGKALNSAQDMSWTSQHSLSLVYFKDKWLVWCGLNLLVFESGSSVMLTLNDQYTEDSPILSRKNTS